MLALSACLCIAACGTALPRLPAAGMIAGERIETTVDSPVARYYLATYLQGRNEDPQMHARIDAAYRRYDKPMPTREDLAALASELSVDFAALFLADRLLAHPCNRAINRAFAGHLDGNTPAPNAAPYLLLFVPGWDYVDNGPVTGADFARPRQLATRLGFENHLARLRPTGSIEENAQILAAEIARHARPGKKIVLAGSSSAGPTIHLALGESIGAHQKQSIVAWLNIGGLLQGSPIVEHLRSGPRRLFVDLGIWWRGWSHDAVASLGTGPRRPRFAGLRIDPGLLVVNYLGVPLSGQVGRHSRDTYPVLRLQGPNDGLTLLADAIAPGSLTIVALGNDHFFADDPRIDEKTVALMKLMVSLLEQEHRCTV